MRIIYHFYTQCEHKMGNIALTETVVKNSYIVVKFTDEQYTTIYQLQDVSTRGSLSTAYK